MKTQMFVSALFSFFLCAPSAFGQGLPTWIDEICHQAWPNPVLDLPALSFDPFYNAEYELQQQTPWLPSIYALGEKHKYYFVYGDHDKEDGIAGVERVSLTWCTAWLEWSDPAFPNDVLYYPDVAGDDYEAIPFWMWDQGCFQNISGPYSHTPFTNAVIVGDAGDFYTSLLLAFANMGPRMGAAFGENKILAIKESNMEHNDGSLKSDLRASLVNEFLALNPSIPASEIPIDSLGDTLVDTGNGTNVATVCHIIPAIAPEGNQCGRNSMHNAMLVSSNLQQTILNNGMPAPGLIAFMQYLADKYEPKSAQPPAAPSQEISFQVIRDLRQLRGMDIEFLSKEETRAILDYLKNQRANRGEPTPAPKLEPLRR